MRLSTVKSKNATSFYVIKSIRVNGKNTSKVVEKLGTYDAIKKKYPNKDPYEWAKERVDELNKKEKEGKDFDIIAKFSPSKLIPKDSQVTFNGGYLFLQSIYHALSLDEICKKIKSKYKFNFDLNSILSRLIYTRILYPSSKLSSFNLSKKFIEFPNFELQHIYRALDFLNKESDFIQSSVYKNSLNIINRKTEILYYDCTNFFFEIEEEDSNINKNTGEIEKGLRSYGYSKEHRPNPIVQMGLFMDASGIPLAFTINSGNTNEQVTLRPLEEKILKDFDLSKFIVCTDAGLSSNLNKKFNSYTDRAYITSYSIKKSKDYIKTWALNKSDWKIQGTNKRYNLSDIDEDKFYDSLFYKERWINENGIEERIVVTYSIKHRNYQRNIRRNQINRALKVVDKNPKNFNKINQNDYRRLIEIVKDKENEGKTELKINNDLIEKEEAYDGFYAVSTNLEGDVNKIININKRRWEIEECFRIMKSELSARPVYLSREERIQAHFNICFLSLLIYRILEKILEEKFTCSDIISNLKDMNFYKTREDNYIPAYIRNDFTDLIHKNFELRTDKEIISKKNMKEIIKKTKSTTHYAVLK